MGLFSSSKDKIKKEYAEINTTYSSALSKDIKEYHNDLKTEYDEHTTLYHDFKQFTKLISPKLTLEEATQLTHFIKGFHTIDGCAKNGIEALHQLERINEKRVRQALRELEY